MTGIRPLHRGAFQHHFSDDGHWLFRPTGRGWVILGRRDLEHAWLREQGIAGNRAREGWNASPQQRFDTLAAAVRALQALLAAHPPSPPFPDRPITAPVRRADPPAGAAERVRKRWVSADGHWEIVDDVTWRDKGLLLQPLTEQAKCQLFEAYGEDTWRLFPRTLREAQLLIRGLQYDE